MPVNAALEELSAQSTQCGVLIANIHRTDIAGNFIMPELDRKQVTVAAFLNLFIAWEHFLEEVTCSLLVGHPTRNGTRPFKYASPPTTSHARALLIGPNKYFDYGNQEIFKKVVKLYFDGGAPFEPHISSITNDLADMRTIRNASAHITSTTQTALESLAQRILRAPHPGIDVYTLITSIDPSGTGGATVFSSMQSKLLTAAQLIANG